MNKQQVAVLVLMEVVLVLVMALHPSYATFLLFGIMQLHLFAIRTAFYVKKNSFQGADWVRRAVYFVPYAVAFLLLMPETPVEEGPVWLFAIFAIVAGFALLFPRREEILPFYNRELMSLFPPLGFRKAALENFTYIMSAVMQELFYKAFVIAVLYPLFGPVIAVGAASFLFMAEHALHHNAKKHFRLKDYGTQLLMGVVTGVLYLYSGSVLVPILAHFTYNFSISASFIVRYFVTRPRPSALN
jgi:membrane protease YdiL (CAAX protease family)